jgi:hypothetical protein
MSASASPRRESGGVFVVVAAGLLATIPIWLSTFPPMTDLPQHAAAIALLQEMRRGGFPYEASFQFNWFTPYLFGYLLVYGLLPFVGIVTACKIIVSLALAAMPVSTALVLTESGTDSRWALLTIPAMYGFAYQWGFLNFLVAAPLGLLFVWLTLRQARNPTIGGALALGVSVVGLFFCHALICAFFGLIAGGILLLSAGTLSAAIRRLMPLTTVVPVIIVWAAGRVGRSVVRLPAVWDLDWFFTAEPYYAFLAQSTTQGGWGWGRVTGLFPRLLGMGDGGLSALFGLALVLLPFAAGARLTRRPAKWIPFIACVAALLFMPGVFFDAAFLFQRFSMFALPLFLMTLEAPAGRTWPRWTWPACGALAAGWIGIVSLNTMRYESNAAGFDQVLARMEPGERALSFAFERDADGTIAPVFLHFPSWYAAVKAGLVDPSIVSEPAALVHYRPTLQPVAGLLAFEWNPGAFEWTRYGGAQYRYFVVRAPIDLGPRIFAHATCNIRLAYYVNHWWLYERMPGCVG